MKKSSSISFLGQTIDIEPKEKLSDEKLHFLVRFCTNTNGLGDLSYLSTSQKKQVAAKAIQEAEGYKETHSMRYCIMRDVTNSLFNLAKKVRVIKENGQYCVYMLKGSKPATNPIGVFVEYNAMSIWCRFHCFKFDSVIGE
jgi:hypothetical protein